MYKQIKRLIDFCAALIGLLCLSPILIITTLILKFTGEGRIFFTQQRVGYKNKLFKIWKFITMVPNAQQARDGTITGKHDMRITPIGHFLRNSKIDEFPQLFNVLKGDMSFVGPRPLMKDPDFDSYPPEVQETIYNVRPGITAIGSVVFRDEAALITQVKEEGGNPAAFKKKVIFPYKGKVEMWYNENQSLWIDLKILMLTAWTLIFPTSQLAYKTFKGLPKRNERLKIEFDRMQQLRESITLILLVVLVLIPLVPSPFWFWNNPQFVLMGLIPVLSFGYLLFRENKMPIQVIPSDIGWAVFIGIGFLSYFWAVNGSLVWYPAFGWLSLVLWMLIFRVLSLTRTAKNIMPLLFFFFFLVIMFHHVLALSFDVPINKNWNHFFGKNANYTSTFLVSFFPFLLFYESKHIFFKILKPICTLLTIYVVYVTHAYGAGVAFLFVVLYYFWSNRPRKHFWSLLGLGFVFLLCLPLIYSYNPNIFSSLSAFNDFTQVGVADRLYMTRASFWIFIENPIAGIGLGNWHLEAFKYDLSNIAPYNSAEGFIRNRSHNLFSSHLAELGLIGFLAFIIPIGKVVWESLYAPNRLSVFQQSVFASLLVYLITSIIYCDINFYEYHFSSIQLLAFCSLGILTTNNKAFYRVSSIRTKTSLLVIALFCLGWFVYTKINYDNYREAKLGLSNKKPEESIKDFQSFYNPVFKTTHDYETSLALQLAKLYQQIALYDKAEEYFQIALQQAPYNGQILLNYATFLQQIKKDSPKAKVYASRIYPIQKTNYQVNLLLAEIAIEEKEYGQAREYLSAVRRGGDPYISQIRDLEKRMLNVSQ